ncbi:MULTISPECIES: dTDP-4-dehydrorhamnose reductase [unclassified Thioalkalivibrio]|uniref:dTDP-4-dehydrorhamnose reductase n=1 Tax=unclassified Thioalkalivibrio TaxID=2621013 RepID=UPI00037170AC|nr:MULTISPECIES: dTDP-4-dehydrorhamnose reductase [unclassified Thioalkalivibrio]
MTRILITGCRGQLGRELVERPPPGVELCALDRASLDITSEASVTDTICSVRPDWIVNTAAYTAVDQAEDDREQAFAINQNGPSHLARAAARVGARLVQVSTDYVFDGTLGRPARPDDPPRPVNVYGASKHGGENAVLEILGDRAVVLRTAWVYSTHGHNFLNSMLRLMAERESLTIVEDQIGSPTSTAGLAKVIFSVIQSDIRGVHHWTDAGVASWFDFAVATHARARSAGLLSRPCHITPIPSSDFPTRARRPLDSRLDKSSLRQALDMPGDAWSDALDQMVARIQK